MVTWMIVQGSCIWVMMGHSPTVGTMVLHHRFNKVPRGARLHDSRIGAAHGAQWHVHRGGSHGSTWRVSKLPSGSAEPSPVVLGTGCAVGIHCQEGEEALIREIVAEGEAGLHDWTRCRTLAEAKLACLIFGSTQCFGMSLFIGRTTHELLLLESV